MFLIKNGIIHNGKGQILNGADILVNQGVINDIDYSIDVKEGVDIVEAGGKTILPGFIDALNVWGCMGPGWNDNDLNEHSDPVLPHMDVTFAFDQDSMSYQRVFEYGVTCAGITPSIYNVIGGQAAVFKTYGRHPYKMLVKDKVAMIASISKATKKIYGKRNLSPMTKMGAFALLKQALIEAVNYDRAQEDIKHDAKKEALKPVLEGKMPLFINCNSKSEMDAVELALREYHLNIVYTGAYGVDSKTAKIVKKKRSIILGDLTSAMSYENSRVDFNEIAKLIAAGVDVAISSCGDHIASGKESLLWNAILCYKYGLDSEEVLKMITSIPAKLLGVDDRVGSIEVGKDADIVIWSANPIKTYAARVEATYINGKNVLNEGRNISCW